VNDSHNGRTDKKGQRHQSNTLFSLSMAEKKVIINLGDPNRFTTRLLQLLIKPGLSLIHFNRMEAWFKAFASDPRSEEFIFQKLLDGLKIGVDFNREQLATIPSEGPLIVIAPHKLVLLDGLAIASAMMLARKDLKTMVVSYLRALPDLRPYIIEVKQGNSKRAKRRNKSAFWKAMVWLKDGHTLIVFPSGQIAARKPLWNPHSVESEWTKSLALLIKGSKANVLPVFVHGETSLAFQIVRRIHLWAERFMSPGEILSMENQTLRLMIGNPILYDELKTIGSGSILVDYLRKRTYDLEHPITGNSISTYRSDYVAGRDDDSKKKYV
jgi:putative hemolysin